MMSAGAVSKLGDRYELLHRLAVGGMGEVFLAREWGIAGFTRLVAVKRLLPDLVEHAELVEMFIDEARIAAQLSHGGIVQVHDFGRADGAFFIAMEYVAGQDLARVQRRMDDRGRRLTHAQAAWLAAEVARALDYAHDARDADGRLLGLVHRDVSPHNVLVSYQGDVKLMDFGIAKAANRWHRTESGAIRGKLGYMAPEQVSGARVDRRTDVFALGVMLWELCLGRRLFSGGNDLDVARAICDQPAPKPREVDAAFPVALEAIILAALERKVEARTPDARTVAASLRDYLAGAERIDREEVGALIRDLFPDEKTAADQLLNRAITGSGTRPLRGPAAEPTTELPGGVMAATPEPRRRSVRLGAIAVAALVSAAAAGWWLGRPQDSSSSAAGGEPSGAVAAASPAPDARPAEVEESPGPSAAAEPPPPIVPAPALEPAPEPAAPARTGRASRRGAGPRSPVREPARHPAAAGAPTVAATEPDPVGPPAAHPQPAAPAWLIVAASPWGNVSIDGKQMGQSDLRASLPSGDHHVQVDLSGGAGRVSGTATLIPGRTTKCRATAGALRCSSPR